VITCWQSLYRPAEGRRVADRAIIDRARAPLTYARKDDVPRWAGAEFRQGYRALANLIRASWVILDFDEGATREQIAAAFGDYFGVGHTTWTADRWRVGLVLSRHVSLDEHERVWRAGAALAEANGLAPDYAARSPAHCFALPARHEGDAYQHVELAGAFFEVATALAQFPAPEPMPEPPRADRTESYEHRLERARKYLAAMPGGISGSGGHETTFRAAVAMIRGFDIEPDDALRLLVEVHNPMCAPPWSERELRHKVKQAFNRSKLPFGSIADRPFERRTA
jgi:hypothetical protein